MLRATASVLLVGFRLGGGVRTIVTLGDLLLLDVPEHTLRQAPDIVAFSHGVFHNSVKSAENVEGQAGPRRSEAEDFSGGRCAALIE